MAQITTKLATAAAIAGIGFGGVTLANAATTPTTPSGTTTTQSGKAPDRDQSKGGHQANGKTEVLLTGTTAEKVKAAALAKVPGGTVERVENDADSSSPYEAHVTKSDGSEVVVLVDSSFTVTAVNAFGH